MKIAAIVLRIRFKFKTRALLLTTDFDHYEEQQVQCFARLEIDNFPRQQISHARHTAVLALSNILSNDYQRPQVRRDAPWLDVRTSFQVSKRFPLLACGDLLACLLYTSDAADERSSVDLGGRRIIK